MNWKAWISATRPKTLSAALAPVIVASAYSFNRGGFQLWISICALLACLAIQIACNLFNDAIDFKKGADKDRQGPTRITQSGEASYEKVMFVAKVFLGIAVLFGIPLVVQGGLPILGLGLFSLFFSYAYTGGPFPLAYLGIADFFVILFFGIISVGGLSYLHLAYFSPEFLILGLQVGLLCDIMLAVNNLRDFKTDKLVGKNTLVARFGEAFGKSQIVFLVLGPFLLNYIWFLKGMYYTALVNYILFFPGILYCFSLIRTEVGPKINKFLPLGSLYYLSFSIFLAIGMCADRV